MPALKVRWFNNPVLRHAVAYLVLLPVLAGILALGQAPGALEYQVKAAMLYNFTKFVEWPARALGEPASPVVVGIFGRDPFGVQLDEVVEGKTIYGHPIRVQRLHSLAELANCNIVFIAKSEDRRMPEVLQALGQSSVLTVGDSDASIKSGVVMSFAMKEGRVQFQVNTRAAQSAGLKVSSKLLKLAVAVVNEQPGGGD